MKRDAAALVALAMAALGLAGCSRTTEQPGPEPVTVSGKSIQVRPDSKLMTELDVVPVGQAPGGERKLRTVGQMIALANSSGALGRSTASWVTLGEGLVRSLGLRLSESAPVGLAYGVTTAGLSYRNDIHVGEKVEIFRYGLRQGSISGEVTSIRAEAGEENGVSVVFAIARGEDWYPGTNCQVEFPLIRRQAVALSPLSMLHEGLREFVLKEVAPGQYVPEEITVVNETKDQVYALGELAPGDRIVERGAILLKPLVHQLGEARHDPKPEVPGVR